MRTKEVVGTAAKSYPAMRRRRTIHISLKKLRAMLLMDLNGNILARCSPDAALYLNYQPDLGMGCRVLRNCLNVGDGNTVSALLVCGRHGAAMLSMPVCQRRAFESEMPVLRFFHDEKVPIQRIMDSVRQIQLALPELPSKPAHRIGEASAAILISCQRLLDSINGLAEGASRLDSPHPRACELVHHVRNVCAESMGGARAHGLTLRFCSNADAVPAMADPSMISRIVQNLLSNAFRYTPCGGHIQVEVNALSGQRAQIIVEDDGPGVPPEIASHIFGRFVKAQNDASAGSGLGLNNVKTMAALHSGSVFCHSIPGRGTRIEVVLPLNPFSRNRRRRKGDALPGQMEFPMM